MVLMVEIGPEQVDISFFDQVAGQLVGELPVMSFQGEQVELEETAGVL